MADLITGLACFLAVIDLQASCCQVQVTRLLDVCRHLLLLRAELVIVLNQFHPLLVLL